MLGTMKMFCIRMNILSQRNNIVLFLACNMAAMQNLYNHRFVYVDSLHDSTNERTKIAYRPQVYPALKYKIADLINDASHQPLPMFSMAAMLQRGDTLRERSLITSQGGSVVFRKV